MSSAMAAISPWGEIIVVADGDTDGSWQFAEKSGLKVLKIPEAGGPAKARNLGACEATGDLLFFIDADVAIVSDTVECVTAVFRDNPDIAALFGSYDDEPSETNLLSQYKNLLHHYVHQTSKEDAFSFWTGCGAIRRDIFMEIGGFNETYRYPSIEDIELGYRLKKTGHKIRLVKEIQVKHLKRWDMLSLVKTDFFCRALPWTGLILKESLLTDDLNLKTSARISTISVYLLLFMGVLSLFSQWLLIPVVCCIIILLVLNRDLYLFFLKK
ncbi:glycosyltransferase, partial [Desulfococcaceae bacterium HSG7]|nr:glycosyltransferase [Desulfococcaceae bacterium HSG7]